MSVLPVLLGVLIMIIGAALLLWLGSRQLPHEK